MEHAAFEITVAASGSSSTGRDYAVAAAPHRLALFARRSGRRVIDVRRAHDADREYQHDVRDIVHAEYSDVMAADGVARKRCTGRRMHAVLGRPGAPARRLRGASKRRRRDSSSLRSSEQLTHLYATVRE